MLHNSKVNDLYTYNVYLITILCSMTSIYCTLHSSEAGSIQTSRAERKTIYLQTGNFLTLQIELFLGIGAFFKEILNLAIVLVLECYDASISLFIA